jgi:hypothetical protein
LGKIQKKINHFLSLKYLKKMFVYNIKSMEINMAELFGKWTDKQIEPFTLQEHYDISQTLKLLQTNLIDDDLKGSIRKYLKYGKNQKNNVLYHKNDIGRLKICLDNIKKDKKTNEPIDSCRSHYNFKKVVKSAMCDKYYVDLDIVNCHPVILLHVFNSMKYDTTILSIFVEKRDKFFKDLQKYKISRDECKALFMCIFYGGKIFNWCQRNNFDITKVPKIYNELEEEIVKNRNQLLQMDPLFKYTIEAQQKKNDGWNIQGTALSYFIQTIECKMLLTMYEWLKQNKYKVGALIHDGLHLQKQMKDKEYDKIIKGLHNEIFDKIGIKVTLKIKPFEEVPELNDIRIISNDKEGGDIVSDSLKHEYIKCQNRTFMRINDVWTFDEKAIKQELKTRIGNMDLLMMQGDDLKHYSKMAKGCMNILTYVVPTDDDEFSDKLFDSNLGLLCFKNGVWDFKQKKLVPYNNNIYTAVKINKDYKESTDEEKKEVMDKIFLPIFGQNIELMNSWLNSFCRGLAGHIEDKNWIACMGERDCGKGVLVGLTESAFGDYVRTTNGENFLFKNNSGESSKALSWLLPFEHKRLLLTNEITRDSENKNKINGNTLKKLASGGDKIEARSNHKDEINFKVQARPFMFLNDLPPIEPADAKETSLFYKFPSKFVAEDDDRLGKSISRPLTTTIMKDGVEDTVIKTDSEGNTITEIICSYQLKNDDIKGWSRQEWVTRAFMNIIFDNYSNRLPIPECMKQDTNDFKEGETEEQLFKEMFYFVGSKYEKYGDDGTDTVEVTYDDVISSKQLKYLVKKNGLNMSPQKYKMYLESSGCYTKSYKDSSNKLVRGWAGLVVNPTAEDD